jgi:hypothetical protein
MPSIRRAAALLSLPLLACAGTGGARPHPERTARPARAEPLVLRYVIARRADDSLALRVRLELPPMRDTVLGLWLPDEWAGRRGLYANVIDLHAVTPGARVEPGRGPAGRRLHAPVGAAVAVEWTLRGVPGAVLARDAHNHTDITPWWAQLVGYDALVLPDLPGETPVRASFAFAGLPRGAVVATSFGAGVAPRETVFVALGTLGELPHAVYTAGALPGAVRLHSRRVPGGIVHVAVRGAPGIADSLLADALRRVVTAERLFWRDRRPPTYVVSVGVAPRGTLAGTRLSGSFIANIDPTRAHEPGVLSLFGHELMHDWIGGTLRPDPTARDGSVTWFTEGFTEYATHRVLWHAGVLSDSTYLAVVNNTLLEHAISAARDLPWDTVIARYWTDAAAQRQPYLRGHLLALRLDAAIREATLGRRSLDDLLRALLFADGGRAPLVTDSLLADAFAREIGTERARHEIDAARAGGLLQVPAAVIGACARARVEQRPRWEPGFDVEATLATRRAQGVRAGSAAERAGLRDGMAIAGASIWRGDATRAIELRVRADSAERKISFYPASEVTVPVEVLAVPPGCRMGS